MTRPHVPRVRVPKLYALQPRGPRQSLPRAQERVRIAPLARRAFADPSVVNSSHGVLLAECVNERTGQAVAFFLSSIGDSTVRPNSSPLVPSSDCSSITSRRHSRHGVTLITPWVFLQCLTITVIDGWHHSSAEVAASACASPCVPRAREDFNSGASAGK